MREQMFDRHVVADEREILAEDGTRRRREIERAVLDETRDRDCRQSFGAARDGEPGVDLIWDLIGAMRKPIRLRELNFVADVDSHDAGETARIGDRIDCLPQLSHLRSRRVVRVIG